MKLPIGLAGRKVTSLLLVSLAFNLFLVGLLLAGHPLFHGHGGPHLPGPPLEHLMAGMNESDRAIMRQAFEKHKEELHQAASDLLAAREAVRTALLSQPFESDALRASIDAAEAQRGALRRMTEESLIEAAAALSPDGRRQLAAARHLPD